jgi:hypothetical protein
MTSTAAALAPVPLDSSLLASVTYHSSQLLLDLEFCDGAIYRYLTVPAAIYHDLLAAESKGSYFNRQIRNHFRYERLRKPR